MLQVVNYSNTSEDAHGYGGGTSDPFHCSKTSWLYNKPLSCLQTSNVAIMVLHDVTIILAPLNMPGVMVTAPPTHSIVQKPLGCTNNIVVASLSHCLS